MSAPTFATDNERLYYNGMEALQTALNGVDVLIKKYFDGEPDLKMPENRIEALSVIKEKAAKWDALDKKIASCYFDEEGNEREDGGAGLDNIGEYAAAAFGYL